MELKKENIPIHVIPNDNTHELHIPGALIEGIKIFQQHINNANVS